MSLFNIEFVDDVYQPLPVPVQAVDVTDFTWANGAEASSAGKPLELSAASAEPFMIVVRLAALEYLKDALEGHIDCSKAIEQGK
eukprot:scaffold152789_cov41-Prasinocladus_malaysianus.AAC.2